MTEEMTKEIFLKEVENPVPLTKQSLSEEDTSSKTKSIIDSLKKQVKEAQS